LSENSRVHAHPEIPRWKWEYLRRRLCYTERKEVID